MSPELIRRIKDQIVGEESSPVEIEVEMRDGSVKTVYYRIAKLKSGGTGIRLLLGESFVEVPLGRCMRDSAFTAFRELCVRTWPNSSQYWPERVIQ